MDDTHGLAYLAGFIDGEGSISSGHSNQRPLHYSLMLYVTQLNPEPLLLLHERFGGIVRRQAEHDGYRTKVVWQISGLQAAGVIVQLLPYLTVKREEAEVALQLQERISNWGGGSMTEKEAEAQARHGLYLRLKELKHRSYDDVELPATRPHRQDHSGPRLRMKVKPKPAPKVRHKVAAPVKSTGYRRHTFDDADVAILAAVYRDHGLAETAREYGVSRQTVINWLDRYGIPRQGRTEASETRRKAAVAASWK